MATDSDLTDVPPNQFLGSDLVLLEMAEMGSARASRRSRLLEGVGFSAGFFIVVLSGAASTAGPERFSPGFSETRSSAWPPSWP